MTEIRPCPFCGGKGKIIHTIKELGGTSTITCEMCGAKTEDYIISFKYSSDEKAIKAWNRRT